MEHEEERLKDDQEPEAKNPKVPPASETWVEGQPASDADYGGGDEPAE